MRKGGREGGREWRGEGTERVWRGERGEGGRGEGGKAERREGERN